MAVAQFLTGTAVKQGAKFIGKQAALGSAIVGAQEGVKYYKKKKRQNTHPAPTYGRYA